MVTLGQSDVTMGEVHVNIPKYAMDSVDAIADAVVSIRQMTDMSKIEIALAGINEALNSLADKQFKFEPYVHVTQSPPVLPDIKLPTVNNKNDIVINLPKGFIVASFLLQVFTILSTYGILRFFPR